MLILLPDPHPGPLLQLPGFWSYFWRHFTFWWTTRSSNQTDSLQFLIYLIQAWDFIAKCSNFLWTPMVPYHQCNIILLSFVRDINVDSTNRISNNAVKLDSGTCSPSQKLGSPKSITCIKVIWYIPTADLWFIKWGKTSGNAPWAHPHAVI